MTAACATRNVICYQMLEAEMKPIVQSIRARMWMWAVERGEEPDVGDVAVPICHRLMPHLDETDHGQERDPEAADDDRMEHVELADDQPRRDLHVSPLVTAL